MQRDRVKETDDQEMKQSLDVGTEMTLILEMVKDRAFFYL